MNSNDVASDETMAQDRAAHEIRALYLACATALEGCIAACGACADACLWDGHVQDMQRCIVLDNQCRAVCQATLDVIGPRLVVDRSALIAVLEACRAVCEACARECSRHDATHCQSCATAARVAAEACANIIASSGTVLASALAE